MTEQEIRKKYQRDDETDLRGANVIILYECLKYIKIVLMNT